MPKYHRIATVLASCAILVSCVAPPPPSITGVSSKDGQFVLTYTLYDSSGVIAYHCVASVPFTVALTDANGVEYQAVTQAIATSRMDLYGGAGCNPFFWTVHVWMECTPDCGGPQGMWNGSDPRRVAMGFKREPGLSQVVVHIEATYGTAPAQGEKMAVLPIRCGALPTNGVHTCLFQ